MDISRDLTIIQPAISRGKGLSLPRHTLFEAKTLYIKPMIEQQ